MMIHGDDGGFDQGLLFGHDLHLPGILAARMPVILGLRGQRIAPHVYPLTITHIYQHQDIQRWTQTAISDAIAPDDEQGGARAWADRSRNDCADGP
jgi:hypothetical protein